MSSMIPMINTVTVHKASTLDAWGIPTPTADEILQARVKVTLNEKEKDGSQSVPQGSVLFEGLQHIAYEDGITFTAFDGNEYTVYPTNRKVIADMQGKVLFTKVSF